MSHKRISLECTVVVGVDIGSERHLGYIRGPNRLEVRAFPFSNDRSGFHHLASRVSAAQVAGGVQQVVLALEPTGPYGEALARWARSRGWRVVGVLGAHTSRAKELWGNSPLKSDPKDAQVICDLAVDGKWVTFSLRDGAYAELKALVVHREQLVRRQTALKNQVRALLRVVFPEFQRVVGTWGVFTKTALRLLERFPTPASYQATDEQELSHLLRRWSQGRLREERAQA
ncbi:MAG: transposase, partial [Gemmatimonadales bacterium]|nr:transposase [Gemmatimonadales bacterium]